MVVEDPQSCFTTINEIQKCVISLEQEHKQYLRMVARSTIIGSRFVCVVCLRMVVRSTIIGSRFVCVVCLRMVARSTIIRRFSEAGLHE